MAKNTNPASIVRSVIGKGKDLFKPNAASAIGSSSLSLKNIGKGMETVVIADFLTFVSSITIGVLVFIVLLFAMQFTLIIINSGAYITPFDSTLSFLGSGGIFDCAGAGAQVHPPNIELRLLPDFVRPRPQRICFTPTEIVIHWSGGWNGVTGTYNTLVSRDLSCHFATDESIGIQMLQLWDKAVELSYCQGSYSPDHNYLGIGIEMSGLCFSSTPISDCGMGSVVTPPPVTEFNRTVDLVCWLKSKYSINTIVGHYQINPVDKTDPGAVWLQTVFIPAVNAKCP